MEILSSADKLIILVLLFISDQEIVNAFKSLHIYLKGNNWNKKEEQRKKTKMPLVVFSQRKYTFVEEVCTCLSVTRVYLDVMLLQKYVTTSGLYIQD